VKLASALRSALEKAGVTLAPMGTSLRK
jgi:hypothetical protein